MISVVIYCESYEVYVWLHIAMAPWVVNINVKDDPQRLCKALAVINI